MIRIEFLPQDLIDIQEASDNPELTDKIKRKLMCLRMHQQSVSNTVIASVLHISINTVTNYLKEYQQKGLQGVLENRAYQPQSKLKPFLSCIECSFKAMPPQDVAEAMHRITMLTGIELQETQIRKTLHDLGLRYRKTGVIPGKANPQMQFDFLEQQLLPKLEEAEAGKRKVYFVDAAHFVLGSFLGMVWCFSRLFIKSGAGRQRYNVLGALDSHTKEVITVRSTENINAFSVCDLIDNIRCMNPDKPITLVMDNARYQRCEKVTKHAASTPWVGPAIVSSSLNAFSV